MLPNCSTFTSRCVFALMLIISSSMLSTASAEIVSKGYTYNPYVPLEIWQSLEPYFLPKNHRMRPFMDKTFHAERITLSVETLKKAGFKNIKFRRDLAIILGKHKNFPHYLLKIYVDTQPFVNEWWPFMERIRGAEAIRACIKKHGFEKHFEVPRKWLYPLPADPSPPDDPRYYRKNFVLVVEDMQILDDAANKEAYLTKMTKEKLDAFYVILTEVALDDSTFARNTPFTRNGKMAFIDTERYNKNSIPYVFLLRYLSEPMQEYWQKLIDEGGPAGR